MISQIATAEDDKQTNYPYAKGQPQKNQYGSVENSGELHHISDAVIDGSKKSYAYVKDRVVMGAKATDSAVHKYPYMGILAGALIGIIAARVFRCGSK